MCVLGRFVDPSGPVEHGLMRTICQFEIDRNLLYDRKGRIYLNMIYARPSMGSPELQHSLERGLRFANTITWTCSNSTDGECINSERVSSLSGTLTYHGLYGVLPSGGRDSISDQDQHISIVHKPSR